MIRYLRVKNWRAFDNLELEFEPGTTFIVSPNGVGKTSLILALAWGIFGDQKAISARDSIRAGADSAEVEVRLELPEGQLMSIRRVSTSARVKSEFQVGDQTINETDAVRILEASFGITLDIAAKLAMMVGGGHVASHKALDIKDHLYRAFGVADLIESAGQASKIAKAATKKREAVRTSARERLENRDAIERQLNEVVLALDAQRENRVLLEADLEKARAQVQLLEDWGNVEVRSKEREQALVQITQQVADLLGQVKTSVPIERQLEESSSEIQNAIDETTGWLNEARSRELAAGQALDFLRRTDGATCPTCLRPFHGPELASAVKQQEDAARQAASLIAQLQKDIQERQYFRNQIEALLRAHARLPAPIEPPGEPRPDPIVTGQIMSAASEALRIHDTEIGRLEAQHDSLRRTLTDEANRELQEAELLEAYRVEGAAIAVSKALAEAARDATIRRIDPLVNEIQWRWKQLFGREGLQLRPDGTIVLVVGDRELPWSALSGGERIWARLVTHLLLIGASTQMRFAWFDEPLEHLDPRARRAVAAALATASSAGGPKQLIVTTYEYAIARQLAEDVESTSILHIRHSEGTPPTSGDRSQSTPPTVESQDMGGGRESSAA